MRSSTITLVAVALLFAGCAYESVDGNTAALGAVHDCIVTGAAVFPTGEDFEGEVSDVATVESIVWRHDAPGVSFLALAADADGIVCRQNGVTSADFLGTGTATFNGEEGYGYFIEIEDNRPAPTVVCTGGDDDDDDDDDVDEDSDEDVDEDSDEGVDEHHHDRRRWGHHRGRGHCEHGRGHGWGHDRHDHDCDDDEPEPEVCTSTPAPGLPDFYSIVVANRDGEYVYTFTGSDVVDGDIDIELLPTP